MWAGASRRHGTGVGPAAAGGGGARSPVNFFVLRGGAATPSAVDLPVPSVAVTSLPALSRIPVDLPQVDLGPDSGTGGTPGPGASPGSGIGSGEGSGTGGEGDYIDIASLRTMIVPPPKVPGSVAGHTYKIRFWVGADGRVTRVEIDPPITDEAYRREFLARMLAYQFVPARTRDKRNVASVVTVNVTIGQ